jgi:acyl-CoA synthetase (AMP-forming)/AMP-acid ligase II
VTSDLNATVSGTVAAAFARTCASFPGHDWLTILPETARSYGIEARTWTYREAQVQIERLAVQYAAAGYGHGHRAGLLLLNRPEFLFHWLALNGLGVSVVPINPEWRSAELEYLIGHSEIAVAACLPERAAELAAAARAAGRKLASERSVRCSTLRARPAAPKAASCPTSTSSGRAPGTPASAVSAK